MPTASGATTFASFEEVAFDPRFAEVDQRLRSGDHIAEDDPQAYDFIHAAVDYLRRFYDQYAATLEWGSEGYYYLLPDGKIIRQHKLERMDMLAGMTLALLRMDPQFLASNGKIPLDHFISTLEKLVGRDRLLRACRIPAGSMQATADARLREAIGRSLHRLAGLGFLYQFPDEAAIRPRVAIFRFADPVRSAASIETALQELIRKGRAAPLDDEDEKQGEHEAADDGQETG